MKINFGDMLIVENSSWEREAVLVTMIYTNGSNGPDVVSLNDGDNYGYVMDGDGDIEDLILRLNRDGTTILKVIPKEEVLKSIIDKFGGDTI